MPEITDSKKIDGVQIVNLAWYKDERGRFSEFFRKEWFPHSNWSQIQCNRSESLRGVLRGLHYHHRQVDYWHLFDGAILACLVDLRKSSSTFLSTELITLKFSKPVGLFIPVGVAHGFYTVSDATLMYVVDNYYDGSDEYGLAWNDPTLNIDWGITKPILSDRDSANPRLAEIPPGDMPA